MIWVHEGGPLGGEWHISPETEEAAKWRLSRCFCGYRPVLRDTYNYPDGLAQRGGPFCIDCIVNVCLYILGGPKR